MKNVFYVMLVAAFSLFSCGGNNEKTAADTMAASDAVSAGPSDGKTLYESKCSVCHGKDGKAGIMGAADLTTSTVNYEGALAIVKHGKNTMKAFVNELSPEEMDAVVKFAQSLKK